MKNDPFLNLRNLSFMESRIPALDALIAFIPEGSKPSESVQRTIDKVGFSRWYSVAGGQRVLVPYEGGHFDSAVFTLEKGAWDHETCKVCRDHIPAMSLCWVTKEGPYIILCVQCKAKMDEG
jgi:hypothetical protein